MVTGGQQGHHFPQWVAEQMAAGKMREMVDPKLGNKMDLIVWEQVKRVLNTALWCIKIDKNSQPTMGRVVQMLKGIVEVSEAISALFYNKLHPLNFRYKSRKKPFHG
eukprot:Gb_37080 [translate_table: standard]